MSITLNKILVSDPVDKRCVELLKTHNFDVTCKYGMTQDELIKEIKDYDALVVRSETKVKPEVLAAANKLRVVGRAGTGVDNIDTNAATRRGVIVLNTPGGNSISACELTCAFICSLSRNVAPGCQSLKEGRWDRKLYMGEELQGKTLGVLGLGRIGREVAHRMSAFGMNIIGFDPLVPPGSLPGVEILTLDEVWPRADYITVHTPLIPQTKNLVNDVTLSKCKKGVKVVNVARGGIIDEVALLSALESGQCGGAALDVFSEEPPKSAHVIDLIRHPKVLATPHLGASTAEAQVRVAEEIAEQIIALADPASGYKVTGVVNSPGLSDLRDTANAPWLSLGKALGTVAGKLGGLALSPSWKTVSFELETHGDLTKSMGFLKTAALFGIMSLKLTREPLNLINAPLLAEEAGLTFRTKHNGNNEAQPLVSLTINDGSVKHTISGTCRGGETWLLSIDDATFTSGIPLNESTLIFKGTDASEDCPLIIGELVKSGVAITNMAVASGKSAVWISVHTIAPLEKKLVIPKLKVF